MFGHSTVCSHPCSVTERSAEDSRHNSRRSNNNINIINPLGNSGALAPEADELILSYAPTAPHAPPALESGQLEGHESIGMKLLQY